MEPIGSVFDFEPDMKTVKRSAVHSLVIQFIFRLKGLITMPILTAILLPRELGAFNLVMVTASMLSPLFSLNLTDGPAIFLVQEKSKKRVRDMYNTVVNSALLSFLIASAIFLGASHLWGGAQRSYRFWILGLVFSTCFYKVTSYLLAIFQQTGELVKNSLIRDGLIVVLTILLVVLGYSFKGMLLANIIGGMVGGVLVYQMTRKEFPYRFLIDVEILIRFLKMAIPLLPVFFFSWAIQSSNSYFLAYYWGQAEVGKYAVICGLTGVILSITYALNFFWYPVSARLWVDNRSKYLEVFRSMFFGFAAFLSLAVLLFELDAKVIMSFLVRKPEYHDAYVIMGITALAFSLQVVITLLTAPLYANRNINTILMAYMAGAMASVLLNFFLVPSIGIKGAAISMAVAYLAVVLIMAIANVRMAGFPFHQRRLASLLVLFFLAWMAMLGLRNHLNMLQTLALNAAVISLAAVSIYNTMLNKVEKDFVLRLLKRRSL